MCSPALPEQDLIHQLRQTPGRGTFEAHVTIIAADLTQRERFRTFCAGLGVKCVLIELPQGATRSQPMTSTYHRGELAVVVEQVADLARTLRGHGFEVSRVKLEAVITNEGIPERDEDITAFPAGNYFEFHVKVSLPPGADLAPLRAVCQPHAAHLSSNAFKRDEEGRYERFVTLRIFQAGRQRAEQAFDALLRDLETAGYALSNRLREYTLFDSNSQVDAGWLDAPSGVGNAGQEQP